MSAPLLEHSFDVTWTYVVPPHNDVRVLITQRQDGPFRKDVVGGAGHYYTSVQECARGQWRHVDGSTTGGHKTFDKALDYAQKQWEGAKR